MNELTAYDEAVEEGELRGKLIASHSLLLLLGRKQFGPLDLATETAVKEIHDLEYLERLVGATLTAKSWAELLATP